MKRETHPHFLTASLVASLILAATNGTFAGPVRPIGSGQLNQQAPAPDGPPPDPAAQQGQWFVNVTNGWSQPSRGNSMTRIIHCLSGQVVSILWGTGVPAVRLHQHRRIQHSGDGEPQSLAWHGGERSVSNSHARFNCRRSRSSGARCGRSDSWRSLRWRRPARAVAVCGHSADRAGTGAALLPGSLQCRAIRDRGAERDPGCLVLFSGAPAAETPTILRGLIMCRRGNWGTFRPGAAHRC